MHITVVVPMVPESLKYSFEKPMTDLETQFISIIHDYLQAQSTRTAHQTAALLLRLLPKAHVDSMETLSLGEKIIDLASQTPYHHPGQPMLAYLVDVLRSSPRFVSVATEERAPNDQTGVVIPEAYVWHDVFAGSMRDHYDYPCDEFPGEFVNFMAFMARIWHDRIRGCHFAIWAFREALEEPLEQHTQARRDEYILSAAQWVLWYGQALFTSVLYPRHEEQDREEKALSPGSLYSAQNGQSGFSLHRWLFWKSSFDAIRLAGKNETGFYGQECLGVVGRAVDIMESLEINLVF